MLSRRAKTPDARETVGNLNARIRAWWIMAAVLTAAVALGRVSSIVLFGLMSLLALREFVTLAPTRPERSPHALLELLRLITPLQYFLIGMGWYGLFAILIPVYAFLFIAVSNVLSGRTERFLERTAEIHCGLMVCVYCVSYAPALLLLEIPGYGKTNTKLLFFLVLVVADLATCCSTSWGKLFGRRRIAPDVSPEQDVGGIRRRDPRGDGDRDRALVGDAVLTRRGGRGCPWRSRWPVSPAGSSCPPSSGTAA